MQKLTQDQKNELLKASKSNPSPFVGNRIQAIFLFDKNASASEILELTDYRISFVEKLARLYMRFGLNAIKEKKHVRNAGLILSRQQRAEFIDLMNNFVPSDLFENAPAFWTFSLLEAYIKYKYNAVFKSKTSLQLILKESKLVFRALDKPFEYRNKDEIDKIKKDTVIKDSVDNVVIVSGKVILKKVIWIRKAWLPADQKPALKVKQKKKAMS